MAGRDSGDSAVDGQYARGESAAARRQVARALRPMALQQSLLPAGGFFIKDGAQVGAELLRFPSGREFDPISPGRQITRAKFEPTHVGCYGIHE